MRFSMKNLLFSALLLFAVSQLKAQSLRSVLDKMYTAIGTTNLMAYDMTSSERIGAKMVVKNMSFKVQISPRKVYMKDKDSGVELLYVSGWNNNMPFINPNGFPWVNVSLDLNSSRVRADGHHPVTHAGFNYLLTQMKNTEKLIAKEGEKIDNIIKVEGSYTWNGRSCTKIVLTNPDFKFVDYTCTQSETLYNLCERINVSEYMVMEKNNLGYGAKVYKDKLIKIPNAFAKKVEIFIDKETNLPIYQIVHDDKGVFEKFEFKNLKINPQLSSGEFTTQCASYGFK
jgi:hypothetical protein